MPAIAFDAVNSELRFVPDWFARQPSAATLIRWFVKNGIQVAAGDVIGTLFWDDGNDEPLTAPADCNGTVDAANRRIKYAQLDKSPAQWAVRFV